MEPVARCSIRVVFRDFDECETTATITTDAFIFDETVNHVCHCACQSFESFTFRWQDSAIAQPSAPVDITLAK